MITPSTGLAAMHTAGVFGFNNKREHTAQRAYSTHATLAEAQQEAAFFNAGSDESTRVARLLEYPVAADLKLRARAISI